MRRDSGSGPSPCLPYAPATLKYRRDAAPRPCATASLVIMWSTASLEAPYGLVGRVGSSSVMGTDFGSPYVAAVEEKTSRRTPASRMAPSSSRVPATLLRQYFSGW